MLEIPQFVDTHCHIDSILARDQITWNELQSRMAPVQPQAIVHVACHPEQFQWAHDFISTQPNVYCAYGVHPHEASLYSTEIETALEKFLEHPQAIALGEIGLDYHYDYSPHDLQQKAFRAQLSLARTLGKPVVLHTREANSDTLQILNEYAHPDLKVHVHCYTGTPEFAQQILALPGQYYFGFTGVITFKNADSIRESARVIPQDRLLLETDGPYLAPIPWRGKTAHSGMIPTIAAALAQARNQETNVILEACRENTRQFYGI